MRSVSPYLYFDGNTEEAFMFYQAVFGGELSILRYSDFGENEMGVSPENMNMIAHASVPLCGEQILMGTDTLDENFVKGTNSYIAIEADTDVEAKELFSKLSEDGNVVMELQEEMWAELYGVVVDRFGVQWMVSFTGNKVFEIPK